MDYELLPLPKIYMRSGKECYLDSIRQKLIFITPEETVRQKVISYLVNNINVPMEMIAVEEHLSHYGIKTNKRADIIIHKKTRDGKLFPLAVIECKAPSIHLGDREKKQMLEYCDLIGADYAMLFNGISEICFKYCEGDDQYTYIDGMPLYEEMLDGRYEPLDIGELPERIPFNQIERHLRNQFDTFDGNYWEVDVSPQTEMPKAKAAFNLFEGLLDVRKKMPVGEYDIFTLIEDYGVRMLSYGNASGGSFFGPYRSFLIERNGSTEFVSMSITTYWKSSSPNKVKTALVVAIDNEKTMHHALQLVIDDNLVMDGNVCDFYHHGRIAIGNMGSGKLEELRSFVEGRYPNIVRGKRYFLGRLVYDGLWSLDNPEVMKLIENLISYALIRDEYRAFVKNQKRKN